MADNLDDGEFWLPRQFLADDDKSFNTHYNLKHNRTLSDVKNDDVSRTLPSLSSSSETESDDEDQLAELTRRVAVELDLHSAEPKIVCGSGSPQSTLSAYGNNGKGSSPNDAVSQANVQRETWDLLYAAAGEVEKMRLSENDRYGYNFLRNAPVPSPGFSQPNVVNTDTVGLGFYSQQQLQTAQLQILGQQQRQVVPNSGRNNISNRSHNIVRGGNMGLCMGLSSSAWPHGYGGMRTVFLADKRESTGTGVFLPRRVDSRIQNLKKPACNTGLVPDRAAQALDLNLGSGVGGKVQHKPRFNGENGWVVSRVRSNHRQKRHNNQRPQQTQVGNHLELQLPQEWTY